MKTFVANMFVIEKAGILYLTGNCFREHSRRTNDIDTTEYATFRYDTLEVKNGLNAEIPNTVP